MITRKRGVFIQTLRAGFHRERIARLLYWRTKQFFLHGIYDTMTKVKTDHQIILYRSQLYYVICARKIYYMWKKSNKIACL